MVRPQEDFTFMNEISAVRKGAWEMFNSCAVGGPREATVCKEWGLTRHWHLNLELSTFQSCE